MEISVPAKGDVKYLSTTVSNEERELELPT
jgi:hypothetical protein